MGKGKNKTGVGKQFHHTRHGSPEIYTSRIREIDPFINISDWARRALLHEDTQHLIDEHFEYITYPMLAYRHRIFLSGNF
jgi:hypothetical protein